MKARKGRRRPSPVTSAWVPTVVCSACRIRVANPNGDASAALTEHYRRAHAEAIGGGR